MYKLHYLFVWYVATVCGVQGMVDGDDTSHTYLRSKSNTFSLNATCNDWEQKRSLKIWNPLDYQGPISHSLAVYISFGTAFLVIVIIAAALQFLDNTQARLFVRALHDDDEMQFIKRMCQLIGQDFTLGDARANNTTITIDSVRGDFPCWARWCIPSCWLQKWVRVFRIRETYSTFRNSLGAYEAPSLKTPTDLLYARMLARYRGIVLSKAKLGSSRVDKIVVGTEDDVRTVVHRHKMRLLGMADSQTLKYMQSVALKPAKAQHLILIDETRARSSFRNPDAVNPCIRCVEFRRMVNYAWYLRVRYFHPVWGLFTRFDPFYSRCKRFGTLIASIFAGAIGVALTFNYWVELNNINLNGIRVCIGAAIAAVVQFIVQNIFDRLMTWAGWAEFRNYFNELWREYKYRVAAEEREARLKEGYWALRKYYPSTSTRPPRFPTTQDGRPALRQWRLEFDCCARQKMSIACSKCSLRQRHLFLGTNHPNDSDIGTDDEMEQGWAEPPPCCLSRCMCIVHMCGRHPNWRARWVRRAVAYDGAPRGCCWCGYIPESEIVGSFDDDDANDILAADEIVRRATTNWWRCGRTGPWGACCFKAYCRQRTIPGIYLGDENQSGIASRTEVEMLAQQSHVRLGTVLPKNQYMPPVVYIGNVSPSVTEPQVKALAHWLGNIARVLIHYREDKAAVYIFVSKWDVHNPEVVRFKFGLTYGRAFLEGPNGKEWRCQEKTDTHMIPKDVVEGVRSIETERLLNTKIKSKTESPVKQQQPKSNDSVDKYDIDHNQAESARIRYTQLQAAAGRANHMYVRSHKKSLSTCKGFEPWLVWFFFCIFSLACGYYLYWYWQRYRNIRLESAMQSIALTQAFVWFILAPISTYTKLSWYIVCSPFCSRLWMWCPICRYTCAYGGRKGRTGESLSGRLVHITIPQAAGSACGINATRSIMALSDASAFSGALITAAHDVYLRKRARGHNTRKDGGLVRIQKRYADMTMKKTTSVIPPEWLYQRGLVKRYLQLRYRRNFLATAVDKFIAIGNQLETERAELLNYRVSMEARRRWVHLRRYVLSGRARREALQDPFFEPRKSSTKRRSKSSMGTSKKRKHHKSKSTGHRSPRKHSRSKRTHRRYSP